MTLLSGLLATISRGADPGPFALLRRETDGEPPNHLDVLVGDLTTVDRLAGIPLPPPYDGPAGGPATLALVPFRQIVERGFACVDDGAPLECLRISAAETAPLDEVLAALPDTPVSVSGGGFDIDDDEYAATVGAVLRDEIGRGEGANFVIHRSYRAAVDGPPLPAALAALRRLLVGERGAYWTFLVHTGTRTLVGATPERHVSVADGLVMMNPISGTHRHGPAGPDTDALLRFLADPKEIDELYMVLDEELKMMAAVAEHGGQVIGPYLKEMSRLAHTEYLLAGRGSRDVREVLRETMFAPTVTGSPIENAFRVIARHERRGRGYYGGVLALLGHDDAGRQTLDAPILIRTVEFSPDGALRLPVGATLVRHSTAAGEVAETHVKAAGVLAALGELPPGPPAGRPVPPPAATGHPTPRRPDTGRSTPPPLTVAGHPGPRRPDTGRSTPPALTAAGHPGPATSARLVDDPRVRAALAARNDHLARFWLDDRGTTAPVGGPLAGLRALVVDAEDTFTGMLAHQLRSLGLAVAVRPYSDFGSDLDEFRLVVAGPGPGDPGSAADPKMTAVRSLAAGLLERGRPLLGVCLGHQILAGLLGLRLHRRVAPYQGLQRDVELFGEVRRVGFYSTFTPVSDRDEVNTPYGAAVLARDPVDGAVHALRGPAFAGVQFHPESVLSRDGLTVLRDLLTGLLVTQPRKALVTRRPSSPAKP